MMVKIFVSFLLLVQISGNYCHKQITQAKKYSLRLISFSSKTSQPNDRYFNEAIPLKYLLAGILRPFVETLAYAEPRKNGPHHTYERESVRMCKVAKSVTTVDQ